MKLNKHQKFYNKLLKEHSTTLKRIRQYNPTYKALPIKLNSLCLGVYMQCTKASQNILKYSGIELDDVHELGHSNLSPNAVLHQGFDFFFRTKDRNIFIGVEDSVFPPDRDDQPSFYCSIIKHIALHKWEPEILIQFHRGELQIASHPHSEELSTVDFDKPIEEEVLFQFSTTSAYDLELIYNMVQLLKELHEPNMTLSKICSTVRKYKQ